MPGKTQDQTNPPVDVKPEDINPQSATDYLFRGWVYYSHKNYRQAEEDYLKALSFNPDDPDIIFAIGLAQKYGGRREEAVKSFERVISIVEDIEDNPRATMHKRLAIAHINDMTQGHWNLETEVWQKDE